tara:strand:+ start:1285 stop:1578 length:294 start_codon:yes stop_codon:yes gene_type:complete
MEKYISKSEIVETLAYKFQIDQVESKKAVDAILKKMINQLADGGRIEVRGFGTLTVRTHPAKITRNPKTGETAPACERHQVHFKPGEPLRNRINQFK